MKGVHTSTMHRVHFARVYNPDVARISRVKGIHTLTMHRVHFARQNADIPRAWRTFQIRLGNRVFVIAHPRQEMSGVRSSR